MVRLVIFALGLMTIGLLSAVAAPPPLHAHRPPVTIRTSDGAIVRWGAIPATQCCREEAYGRVVTEGEPPVAEQRAFYLARDGRTPGEVPSCQLELDATTGACVGWRYGPPAPPPAGRVAVQREPTATDQAQVRDLRERREAEDALVRATTEADTAHRLGLLDREFDLREQARAATERLGR